MLPLCYDGGERGTCLGSVLVAPFVHFCMFAFLMDHYVNLPLWISTVAATPV